MKYNIKQSFNNFVNNSKDYPLFSGFSLGFYFLVFYFSNNIDLVNSLSQLFFFVFYYIVSSILIVFIIYKIVKKSKYSEFCSQSIILSILLLFFINLFGFYNILLSYKKLGLLLILIFIIFKFKVRNNKYLIVFLFLMSVIPIVKLGKIISLNFNNSNKWQLQPDDILNSKFKKTPNIYYIQPDGYASDINLKGSLYRYNNSAFDNWLKNEAFTLYSNYRSNYQSTLYSNSSCFFMKHHLSNEFSNFKYARDYIVGENPVLKIFKNNKYKTFFITERPYLLMNRPHVFYDYCNFKLQDVTHFKDGWENFREITGEIENKIINNKKTNNFFFIEKFNPSHIAGVKSPYSSIEKERIKYIESLKIANIWLKKIVTFIENNDPDAIIIIGADHGGFVGFESTSQSISRITDKKLLNSIFGAKLAIKWSDKQHIEYDGTLRTSVNLFRVLFSYLSEDKSLLDKLQPDVSYNNYNSSDKTKIYTAIIE